VAPTGRIFLMKRSRYVSNPFCWSVPAGRIDQGETPLEAALRELHEEAGYSRPLRVVEQFTEQKRRRKFHYFVALVP